MSGNCRNCKHWTPNTIGIVEDGKAYACRSPKLGDMASCTDGFAVRDVNGSEATYLSVGPGFGCVHFELDKPNISKEDELYCKRSGISVDEFVKLSKQHEALAAEVRRRCGLVDTKYTNEDPYFSKLLNQVSAQMPHVNIPKDLE